MSTQIVLSSVPLEMSLSWPGKDDNELGDLPDQFVSSLDSLLYSTNPHRVKAAFSGL